MSKHPSIFRNASPANPYTSICNSLLRDFSISLDAKGFLVGFLSFPRDWSASLDWAKKNFCIGEQKAERIIKELTQNGYCRKGKRDRRADGTYGPVLYDFTDVAHKFQDEDEPLDHSVKNHPVDTHPVANHSVAHHAVVNHAVETTPYTNKRKDKGISDKCTPPLGEVPASQVQRKTVRLEEEPEELKPSNIRPAHNLTERKEKTQGKAAKPKPSCTEGKSALSEAALKLYNEAAAAHGFPQCRAFTPTRQRRLQKRVEEIGGLENFKLALSAIPQDDFLMGKTPPKEGQAPFKLDLERLTSVGSGMGDLLAKLLDRALDSGVTLEKIDQAAEQEKVIAVAIALHDGRTTFMEKLNLPPLSELKASGSALIQKALDHIREGQWAPAPQALAA